MRNFFSLLILLTLSYPASAPSFENVAWLGCYDGDTCKFTLPGIHPFFGEKISVRIRGIDTPEIWGKCPTEKRKAKAARDYLRNLLRSANRIDLVNAERGKYFRIVAMVRANEVPVSSTSWKLPNRPKRC